jgi:hypothetical protein
MKRITAPFLVALALLTAGLPTSLQAQRPGADGSHRGAHPDGPRLERPGQAGPGMGGPGAGAASMQLGMRIRRTLDQAGALGLDDAQREGLESLLTEVEAANRELMAMRQEHMEAREAQMQRIQDAWQPLPDDEAARREALEQREEQMRSLRASFQQLRDVTQERIREATDPLVQRYESIVPPSQRPEMPEPGLQGRGQRQQGQPGMRGGAGRPGMRNRPGMGDRPGMGSRPGMGNRSGRRGTGAVD